MIRWILSWPIPSKPTRHLEFTSLSKRNHCLLELDCGAMVCLTSNLSKNKAVETLICASSSRGKTHACRTLDHNYVSQPSTYESCNPRFIAQKTDRNLSSFSRAPASLNFWKQTRRGHRHWESASNRSKRWLQGPLEGCLGTSNSHGFEFQRGHSHCVK